jgi:hypothetical protein
MWTNRPPEFMVGPDSAVYIDQPVGPSPGSPTLVYTGPPPVPAYSGTPAAVSANLGYVAQPQAAVQPTVPPGGAVPVAVAQQTTVGPAPFGVPPSLPPDATSTVVAQPPGAIAPFAAPAAPCPPTIVPAPVCVAPRPFEWTIFGDVLVLHPTGADMAHAQQQNGIGGAGTVPFGVIGVADPGFNVGFRVGGEWQFDPCAAVFASYSFFDESTSNTVVAPVIPGGVPRVGSLVHHPGAGLTASTGPVTANYDIEFQLVDVAYRQFLVADNVREVSVFGGARLVLLDQNFLQSGTFAGGLAGVTNTSTNIDFTGGGPMVGIDAERQIDASAFSVYGRALVAALSGSFDSNYVMVNTTAPTTLAQASWSDDRIVPMLDYELGLAWTGLDGHLRLAVGYMASHWFNAVTTPMFVDAVQANNYVDVGDTISFDGLVGHVEFRW